MSLNLTHSYLTNFPPPYNTVFLFLTIPALYPMMTNILCSLLLLISGFLSLSIPGGTLYDPVLADFNAGVTAMQQEGRYNDALRAFHSFIQRAEQDSVNYRDGLMRAYCYVGIIYGSYEDYTLSIEYSKKSLKIADELHNDRFSSAAVNNIAGASKALGHYDEARRYANRLIASTPVTPQRRFSYYLLMADIALADSAPLQAKEYYRRAAVLAAENRYPRYERACLTQNLAKCYGMLEQPDSQLFTLRQALSLAMAQNRPDVKLSVVRQLMKLNTAAGIQDSAVYYQDLYFALSDSLMSRSDFMRIRSDNELKNIAVREQKIDGLSSRVTVLWWTLGAITIVLAVVSTLLVIIVRQNRNLNTAYRVLFKNEKDSVASAEPEAITEEKAASGETPCDADKELFDRIKHVMETSSPFLDPDFGLANLTGAVKSNTAYVSKVIGLMTGDNVRAFINEYRIREARRRIRDISAYGHMTLQAIGESVGYRTQVNFNRTFKRITGMTPSAYLALARKENEAKNTEK